MSFPTPVLSGSGTRIKEWVLFLSCPYSSTPSRYVWIWIRKPCSLQIAKTIKTYS